MALTEFRKTFESAAGDDADACMDNPGCPGLQILFEANHPTLKVTVQQLQTVYEAQGWMEDRSLSWEDFQHVVAAVNVPHSSLLEDADFSE